MSSKYDPWEQSQIMKDFASIMKKAEDKKENKKKKKKQESKPAKETESKSIMEQAHPEDLTVADSLGEGGMVESNPTQHKKMMQVLYTAPSGSNTSKHAFTIQSVIKIADDLDAQGKTEAAKEVDRVAHQIYKEAFVGGLLRSIGGLLAKMIPFTKKNLFKKDFSKMAKNSKIKGSPLGEKLDSMMNKLKGGQGSAESLKKAMRDTTNKEMSFIKDNIKNLTANKGALKKIEKNLGKDSDKYKAMLQRVTSGEDHAGYASKYSSFLSNLDELDLTSKAYRGRVGAGVMTGLKKTYPALKPSKLKALALGGLYTGYKMHTGKIADHIGLYREMGKSAGKIMPLFGKTEDSDTYKPMIKEMEETANKWSKKLATQSKMKKMDPEAYSELIQESIDELKQVRDDNYAEVHDFAEKVRISPGIANISNSADPMVRAWQSRDKELETLWVKQFDKMSDISKMSEKSEDEMELDDIAAGMSFACDNM
jgi:hypothetical protein